MLLVRIHDMCQRRESTWEWGTNPEWDNEWDTEASRTRAGFTAGSGLADRYVYRYTVKGGGYWSVGGARAEVVRCVFCDERRPANNMASVVMTVCRQCLLRYRLYGCPKYPHL